MAHVSKPRPAGLGTALSIVGVLLALGAMFVAGEHSTEMKTLFLMVAATALIAISFVFLTEAFRQGSLELGALGAIAVATGAWFLFSAFQTGSSLALTLLMLIVLLAAFVALGFAIRKGKITVR